MTTAQSQPGTPMASRGPRGSSLAPEVVAPVLLGLGFLALFFRWLWTQHRHSSGSLEDWGHAYIVPLIAAYAVWLNRDRIASLPRAVFAPGLAPLLLGITGYFAAVVIIQNHMIQGAMVLLTLGGAVLTLFGPAVTRAVFLPLLFLVFAITISERVMLAVTFKLQTMAAEGAHVMLSVIGAITGFNSNVQGNTLTVITGDGERIPLNVAEACSGMRMVVAFVALAGSVALLNGGAWWKRIAVLLSAVPVALLMNIIRVAVLGILSISDPELAEGEAHTLIGTILLLPALALFMGIIWALDRVLKEDEKPQTSPPPKRAAVPSRGWGVLRTPAFLVAGLALAGSASTMSWAIAAFDLNLAKRPIQAPDGRSVSAIPTETDRWERVGTDRLESAAVLEELGTRNYLTRIYQEKAAADEEFRVVELHLAYYTGQIDTVPHVPERCFVGGGMTIGGGSTTVRIPLDTSRLVLDSGASEILGSDVFTARLPNRWSDRPGSRVRLPGNPETLDMRITEFVGPDGKPFYTGYFFIANGGTVASAEDVRLLAFDLTDEYAYYMKVQTRSFTASSPEELAEDTAALLDDLYGELARCVPDWADVRSGRYPEDNPLRDRDGDDTDSRG
ncbi:MAG: exosortase/archaeosortase family protein [Planctomycetota bacterium]